MSPVRPRCTHVSASLRDRPCGTRHVTGLAYGAYRAVPGQRPRAAATATMAALGLAIGLTIVPQQHRLFATVPKLAPVAVGLNGSAVDRHRRSRRLFDESTSHELNCSWHEL
jgi:hypothetical protein